jgi:hypothetical protein
MDTAEAGVASYLRLLYDPGKDGAVSKRKRRTLILEQRLARFGDWTLIVGCPRCRERLGVGLRQLSTDYGGEEPCQQFGVPGVDSRGHHGGAGRHGRRRSPDWLAAARSAEDADWRGHVLERGRGGERSGRGHPSRATRFIT